MTELITYIFEFITMILSFIATFLLYHKSRTSEVKIGARFLSVGIALLGLYALSTIFYSLIGQAWAIQVFLKIGIISLIYAVLFLFYTMIILIFSSKWARAKIVYMITIFAIATIISFITIFVDYIKIIDAKTANTHFDPILPFIMFAIYVGFILILSAVALYYFGILKNSGASKKRMMLFFIGLILIILSLITELIGNFIEIEILFDTILFGLLSGASVLFALAFLRGNN